MQQSSSNSCHLVLVDDAENLNNCLQECRPMQNPSVMIRASQHEENTHFRKETASPERSGTCRNVR